MTLFAGIDVGQSGTTAAIGDAERVFGYGHAGPGDEVAQDVRSTRLRDAMDAALGDALARCGLAPASAFDAIVAGISGYDGRVVGVEPRFNALRVTLMHDAPIAHAAAFGDGPGVVVIAGTGSVAYARARDGRTATTGGWGYLFGDEGSAFWIARIAFERATACEGACADAIASFFECASLRAAARAFYEGVLTRDRFAQLAHTAFDTQPIECLARAADEACVQLALLARRAALDAPERTRVAFTGGLMDAPQFAQRICDETRRVMPGCSVEICTAPPADGALALARRS